jgi:hypothetical protein
MLSSYFDKTARIDRLTTTTGNKKEFATHIASLSCHIQPLDPTITQDIPGGFGKNFLMFSGEADIIEGDRVFVDNEEYRVIGTESLTFNGKTHRESIIRIFKS